jgi:hypothetical protein
LQSLLKITRLRSYLERQEVVEDKAGVSRAFAIIAARAALAGIDWRTGLWYRTLGIGWVQVAGASRLG